MLLAHGINPNWNAMDVYIAPQFRHCSLATLTTNVSTLCMQTLIAESSYKSTIRDSMASNLAKVHGISTVNCYTGTTPRISGMIIYSAPITMFTTCSRLYTLTIYICMRTRFLACLTNWTYMATIILHIIWEVGSNFSTSYLGSQLQTDAFI